MSAKDDHIIHIGARNLIESLYRSGSINQISYSNLSAREGTRTHQVFSDKLKNEYRDYEVVSELSLSNLAYFNKYDTLSAEKPEELEQDLTHSIEGIEVNGRCDLLLKPIKTENNISFFKFKENPTEPFIIEVKTVNRPLDEIPVNGEPIHWYQAKIYTYMYWYEQAKAGIEIPESIPYALAYVSVDTLEASFKFKYTDWAELKQWYIDTCYAYLDLAINIQKRLEIRDKSIENLSFPYEKMRPGQAQMIEQVAKSVSRISPLLVEAPTGIGKTISALYPAIKALRDKRFEHIFYLTAKTSTRKVCEETLNDLRKNSGLNLRSITLMAKDQICPYHKDSIDCPYSINYYDNLPGALKELWPVQELKPELIQKVSEKYKVCAYELSLDVARHCDVIICDYNHAFNPQVRLERFFSDSNDSQILLVDEAHNLVDRSRDMYSATLEGQDYQYLLSFIPSKGMRIYQYTQDVIDYFTKLELAFKNHADGFDEVEKQEEFDNIRTVKANNFRATTTPLKNLATLLLPWVQYARQLLEIIEDPKQKNFLINLIGASRFFIRVIDEFWNESYISCARKTKKGVALRLICLDVSTQLSQSYMNKHAAVFFSATLSPMHYYVANFCGTETDNRPDTLKLYSPFPAENLHVYTLPYIDTRYTQRAYSAASLAKSLALSIILKGGQQFIYFSSFAYMQKISPLLRKILKGQDIEIIEQKRSMSEEARRAFLEKFNHPKPGKTLIALVVLGGIFGEGIDLIGDKLTAVSIISVGMPTVSPERNIMSQYYDQKYHQGFNFSYLYPGINKVLQAAGRLIRSENDQGYILLIDSRYKDKQYLQLLPEEWEIEEVNSIQELNEKLREMD